jgi:Xaa-Pro dipeptidase
MTNGSSLSRRGLLAAAPAFVIGVSLPAAAQTPGAASETGPVPPPLPPPFSSDVFRSRQERLVSAMAERKIDAVFVVPSTNMRYLTGLDTGRSERLMALVLRKGVESAFVTPAFEQERVRRDTVVERTLPWEEHEDPAKLAASLLKGARTIGIEGSTDYHSVARIAAATGARVVDASSLFDTLRSVKSEAEKTCIRDAAQRTERAIAATQRRLAEGMSEREVGDILSAEFKKLGVTGGGLVQFGASASLPHGGPADVRLRKGDVVLLDCGCHVRGYSSDVTRTAVFGEPSGDVRKVYAAVDMAQRAAFAVFRAGAIPEQVDRAARAIIESAGWGKFFSHRLGHGLGMDGHEAPYLVRGNKKPLAAGNVCTLEPGIYLPGKFGVRIEDDVAATPDGNVSLSTRPEELLVLRG